MTIDRYFGLCALLFAVMPASGANYIPTQRRNAIDVQSMGAKGDGVTDDTPAIQAAINMLESQGGGVLNVPAGTYLLNSYSPSAHPWFFYNLRASSNILIQGAPGARFLQGPGGRAPLQSGANQVRNTVLAFGTPNYVSVTFQNPALNGGFYSLNATSTGSSAVTLASVGQAQAFHAGDYVAIYAATSGDVIPSETSQVASVNYSTGTLNLAWPLARAFQTPSIANVTNLATYNVGVSGLTIEGTEPLAVTEAFNFTAVNCQFISDLSIGGENAVGLNMNTIRDFRFTADQFSSVGPGYAQIQLPQRNSQTGVIEASTFVAEYVVFGEYAANWTFTGNTFTLFPQNNDPTALALGGLNVTFSGNTVTGTGSVPIMVDFSGLASYAPYVGNMSISNNTITCAVTNSNCILLAGPSATVMNNLIVATGSVVAIKVEGAVPQMASISQNSISVQSGLGIVLNTPQVDQSIVAGNTITGSGAQGIIVASPGNANSGGDVITGNCISGFGNAISISMSSHPGSVVSLASTCGQTVRNVSVSDPTSRPGR